MLSQASRISGYLPTAVTAPVMMRLGKENTATVPAGVSSRRVPMATPAAPRDAGPVKEVVSNWPPAMM
jgi:hypothetical protein